MGSLTGGRGFSVSSVQGLDLLGGDVHPLLQIRLISAKQIHNYKAR